MIMLPIDKPKNCIDCPCISRAENYCGVLIGSNEGRFTIIEKTNMHLEYPGAYTPDWCPIIDVEDDGK